MGGHEVEIQVRKALMAVDGSALAAKRLLVKWAKANPQLLALFVEPHLEAIIGAAVDRMVRPGGASPAGPAAPVAPAKPKTLTANAMDQLIGRLAGNGPAPAALSAKPGKASHEATLRALAGAYQKKRQD